MSKVCSKRSAIRVLTLAVLLVAILNVYLLCSYFQNATFPGKTHISFRSLLTSNAKSSKQWLPLTDVNIVGKSFMIANDTLVKRTRNEQRPTKESVRISSSKNVSIVEKSLRVTNVTPVNSTQNEQHPTSAKPVACIATSISVKRAYINKLRTIVNPHNVNVTFSATKVCKGSVSPYLLIISLSMPSHFGMRETIRKTWASFASVHNTLSLNKKKVELLFLTGRANSSRDETLLKEEHDKYGDILQGDFEEEYSVITRKVLMAFKWTLDNCRSVKYLLKADEDVFVNIPRVLEILVKLEAKSAIIGYRHATGTVFRVGNWGVPYENYKFCHYLPYVEGNSYVISGSLVSPLFNISRYHPYMATEDAYITGILREMIGAEIVSEKQFSTPAKKLKFRNKDVLLGFYKSKMISETRCSKDDMNNLWSAYKQYTKTGAS